MGISFWQILIVVALLVILFGRGKISELMGDVAKGVKSFKKMLSYNESRAPLKRNITSEEVGNAAAFLCSDLASGITGEILYVDAGFNITAMGDLSEAN